MLKNEYIINIELCQLFGQFFLFNFKIFLKFLFFNFYIQSKSNHFIKMIWS